MIFQAHNRQTYPDQYLSADEHPNFKTTLRLLAFTQPDRVSPANRAHIKSPEVSRLETGIVEKADKIKKTTKVKIITELFKITSSFPECSIEWSSMKEDSYAVQLASFILSS